MGWGGGWRRHVNLSQRACPEGVEQVCTQLLLSFGTAETSRNIPEQGVAEDIFGDCQHVKNCTNKEAKALPVVGGDTCQKHHVLKSHLISNSCSS